MTSACEWVEAHPLELVRDQDLPPDLHEHLPECPNCQAMADGARSLRRDLDHWTAPEPPAGLIERSLAQLAVAHAQVPEETPAPLPLSPRAPAPEPQPAGEIVPFPSEPRRRTTMEILTNTPLEETPARPPSPRRLLLRLGLQTAAALVLFGVVTTFVAVFYPAVTYALEERRVERCQEQMLRLQRAAVRYHEEHPEGQRLQGAELRTALVEGGYADELDFVCPGHRGEALGDRSYLGDLPAGDQELPDNRPLYWDRFGNHTTGFNVVYADGRIETVPVEDFAEWSAGWR